MVCFISSYSTQTEGYGVDFGLEQYENMAELARTMEGTNDHQHQ